MPDLIEASRDLSRRHPGIADLVEKRVALLEFAIARPTEPDGLREQRVRVRRALHECLLCPDARKGFKLAHEVSRTALESAGQAVCLVMGKPGRQYGFTANLMVPAHLPSPDGPVFHEAFAESRKSAAALWSHVRVESRCLAVVSSTHGAEHVGFWVPLVRGENSAVLPGAAAAYYHMIGHAVFKDNLPELHGFPQSLSDAWRAYVRTHIGQKMFVSLPLVVQKPSGQSLVIAVLNVNADPPEGETWRRACHDEWLSLARSWVADFAEVAYTAHMRRLQCLAELAEGVEGGKQEAFPELVSGVPVWDAL